MRAELSVHYDVTSSEQPKKFVTLISTSLGLDKLSPHLPQNSTLSNHTLSLQYLQKKKKKK